MVAVRAKGAQWDANTSLLKSLAVGDMYHGPSMIDVTLYFKGNANKTPPKSAHHQFSDL